jgi:hypothetical protein
MIIETGDWYRCAFFSLSNAQTLIKKALFISRVAAANKSCAKLAIPHLAGGNVLINNIREGVITVDIRLPV